MDGSDEEQDNSEHFITSRNMYDKSPEPPPPPPPRTENKTKSESKKNTQKKIDCLSFADLISTEINESEYAISHRPQYQLPIHQEPAFSEAVLTNQVDSLSSYHSHLARNIAIEAKLQMNTVPLPKLIKVSASRVPLRGLQHASSNEVEMNTERHETEEYVNRYGRITKRRIYSDEDNAAIDMKKQKTDFENSQPSTSRVQNNRNNREKSPELFDGIPNQPSTSSNKESGSSVLCPICGWSYPITGIEKHAATCGETSPQNQAHCTRMTCRFCDRVFVYDVEYENHVRVCARSRMSR